TFEQELLDVASQMEVNAPLEFVNAALPSNTTPHEEYNKYFYERFKDNFNKID
ncbi:hypothetical protein K469DRAFT_563680, partial [Zopfia rhizophila CBS 207.26]